MKTRGGEAEILNLRAFSIEKALDSWLEVSGSNSDTMSNLFVRLLAALALVAPTVALRVDGGAGAQRMQSKTKTVPRRAALGLAGALAAPLPALATPTLEGYNPAAAATAPSAGRRYFPPLTPPLFSRATYRYEMGRNAWALEQLLTFANVSATVRTVVIKLQDGTLWVDGPQWPTGEYMALLDELGPVGHVVLPCVALEHKAPMAAFVKRYPKASVWIAPGQYGPFGECGLDAASAKMGYRVDGVFPTGRPKAGDAMPPWSSEFEMRTLYVDLPENAGPVAETAFFHRPTKSLVTTDAVVYVPDEPPPIFGTYFGDKDLGDPSFWPKSVIQAVFLPLREDVGADAASAARWPGYASVRDGCCARRSSARSPTRARPPRCASGCDRSRASGTSTACSPRTLRRR